MIISNKHEGVYTVWTILILASPLPPYLSASCKMRNRFWILSSSCMNLARRFCISLNGSAYLEYLLGILHWSHIPKPVHLDRCGMPQPASFQDSPRPKADFQERIFSLRKICFNKSEVQAPRERLSLKNQAGNWWFRRLCFNSCFQKRSGIIVFNVKFLQEKVHGNYF